MKYTRYIGDLRTVFSTKRIGHILRPHNKFTLFIMLTTRPHHIEHNLIFSSFSGNRDIII